MCCPSTWPPLFLLFWVSLIVSSDFTNPRTQPCEESVVLRSGTLAHVAAQLKRYNQPVISSHNIKAGERHGDSIGKATGRYYKPGAKSLLSEERFAASQAIIFPGYWAFRTHPPLKLNRGKKSSNRLYWRRGIRQREARVGLPLFLRAPGAADTQEYI